MKIIYVIHYGLQHLIYNHNLTAPWLIKLDINKLNKLIKINVSYKKKRKNKYVHNTNNTTKK